MQSSLHPVRRSAPLAAPGLAAPGRSVPGTGAARWRALRRDRSGAAAAEFALITPLLALFVFGLMQMGLLIYAYGSMLNSARTGARLMAFGLTTEAQAVESATALLPPWVSGTATFTTVLDDGGVSRMSISVPGSSAAIINLVPMPGSIDVNVAMPRAAAP